MLFVTLLFAVGAPDAYAEKPKKLAVWKTGDRDGCGDAGEHHIHHKERPYNGIDDDCDASTPDDDLDDDGRRWFEDCNDERAEPKPPRVIAETFHWPTDESPCFKGGPDVILEGLFIEKEAKGVKKLSCICAVVSDMKMEKNTHVKTLHGLEKIGAVGGDVTFEGNSALLTFDGFDGIMKVGGSLSIVNNDDVPDIGEGFEKLTSVTGDLRISGNDGMVDIRGLDQLIDLDGMFEISDNDVMAAMSGLQMLHGVGGDINIDSNAMLAAFQGMAMLAQIKGDVTVQNNPNLDENKLLEKLTALMVEEAQDKGWLPRVKITPQMLKYLAPFFLVALLGLLLLLPYINKFIFKLMHWDEKKPGEHSDEDDFDHLTFNEEEKAERHFPEALDQVSPQELMTAGMHLHEFEIDVGQVLIQESDTDPSAAWIVEGDLEIKVNGVEVGVAHTGEIVGEMSLFGDTARGAEVRAAMATRVLVLERKGYDALVSMNHPVARIFEETCIICMGRRLEDTGRRLAKKSLGTRNRVYDATPDQVSRALDLWSRQLSPVSAPAENDPMGLLSRTKTFAHFTPEQLSDLSQYVTVRQFRAGSPIFVQGDESDEMIVLASGRADMLLTTSEADEAILLDDLYPGDVFGMTSMIAHTQRMASCMALSDVQTLSLGTDQVRALNETDDPLGRAFRVAVIQACAATLREANANIAKKGGGREAMAQNLLQAHLSLLRQR